MNVASALGAGLALGVLCISLGARADTDPAAKIAAQALFDDAQQLTITKRYAEACPKFAESQRLDPSLGTQFFLADCLEHVGKLATAWSYYLEVASGASAVGQKDRETYARGRAEALKHRLPKLTVEVAQAARVPGLVVMREGIALSEPQWGIAIPLDLGKYQLMATAPGKPPWTTTVDVTQEGVPVTVQVPPFPEPTPAQQVIPTPPLRQAPPIKAPAPALETIPPRWVAVQREVGFVLGGVGVAGVAMGAGLGISAMVQNSASKADGHCDAQNRCDATGKALRDGSFQAATISTVGFVAGAAALAGSAVVLLTVPASPPSPRVALGLGSITLIGRW